MVDSETGAGLLRGTAGKAADAVRHEEDQARVEEKENQPHNVRKIPLWCISHSPASVSQLNCDFAMLICTVFIELPNVWICYYIYIDTRARM